MVRLRVEGRILPAKCPVGISDQSTRRGTICHMKKPPSTPEFSRFTVAMRDILKVSKGEMEARMDAQKESGKRLSKGSSSLGSVASSKIRSSIGNS